MGRGGKPTKHWEIQVAKSRARLLWGIRTFTCDLTKSGAKEDLPPNVSLESGARVRFRAFPSPPTMAARCGLAPWA